MSRSNLVWLLIVGGFLLYGYINSADRGDDGAIVSEGSLDVFALRVGDCTIDDVGTADSEADESISSVKAVPCTEPHDNEFYAAFNLEHETFPGAEIIETEAAAGCLEQFAPALGIDFENSVLEYSYMYPTIESWEQNNDREVICMVYHMEGEKLVGNAQGI